MGSVSRATALMLSAALVLPQAAFAGLLEVRSERIPGIPKGGNARITATVPPGSDVSAARVYFNAEGKTPEYYLEMVREDSGKYWVVLPIPKPETKKAQYRVMFRDADGKETSLPLETVPVDKTEVELTEAELRYAKNLVIGVTNPNAPLLPEGWECYGVVSSINIRGELKPNEVCRTVVVPPWIWPAAAAVAGTTGIIIVSDDPEDKPVSPSRPPGTPK